MTDQPTPAGQEPCEFDFEPEFDTRKMYELEQVAQSRSRSDGIIRRIALTALTRSSQELLDGLEEQGGIAAVLEVVECLESTINHLKTEIEYMDAARTRLLWAFNEAYRDEIDRASN